MVRVALIVGVAAAVRQILLERAPEHGVGTEPVLGSLDAWPSVPRRIKN